MSYGKRFRSCMMGMFQVGGWFRNGWRPTSVKRDLLQCGTSVKRDLLQCATSVKRDLLHVVGGLGMVGLGMSYGKWFRNWGLG